MLFVTVVVCAMVVAAPWMVRNFHVLEASAQHEREDSKSMHRQQSVSDRHVRIYLRHPSRRDLEGLRKREVRASEVLRRDAIDWIAGNPLAFVDLALKKAVYFWTPPLHQAEVNSQVLRRSPV